MSIAILIATIVADLVVGLSAMKMAKAATQTNASVLSLLAKHADRLENHEVRIVVLERKAA